MPTDAYGRSKLAAEQGLAELDLDWVALRLVLVYGPGVKGNMAQLLRFARSPYPLPLGGLTGKRSLLSLDNLAEAMDTVLAAGPLRRPLIVADPEPLSVPEMIAAMRRGLGRRPGLIRVPSRLLEAGFRAAGRSEAYERLTGALVADASALQRIGWRRRSPPGGTRRTRAQHANVLTGAIHAAIAECRSFDSRADDVFGHFAGRYDVLCDLFSLRIHRLWKRRVAHLIAQDPGRECSMRPPVRVMSCCG